MATADVLVVSSAVPFPNDASVQTVKTTGSSKQKSLDVDIPQWIKNDLYIVRGYRPQLHSFRACMGSLFYLHNEFVSTWSHLLPAFAFIWMLATDSWLESSPKDTVIASKDLVPVQVYIICTAACLLLSATFHCSCSHSERIATSFLKLDYLGIVLSIFGTCISSTYFGLYEYPLLRQLYIGLIVVVGAAVFQVTLDPRMDGVHAAKWRVPVFASFIISGWVPIVHIALVDGAEAALTRFPLRSTGIMTLFYAIGAAFYVFHFPEKWWPGHFDIWGASHQIFHILVVCGQVVYLLGVKETLLMRYGVANTVYTST